MKLKDVFSSAKGVVASVAAAQTAIVGGLVGIFGHHSAGVSAAIGLGSVATGVTGVAAGALALTVIGKIPALEGLSRTPAGALLGIATIGGGYLVGAAAALALGVR